MSGYLADMISPWGHVEPRFTLRFTIRPHTMSATKSTMRAAIQDLLELERASALTRDGKNWLVQAIDPFHDVDIPSTGYPDANVAGSVVQVVKYAMQISAPTAITSGTWDCHFFNLSNTLSRPLSAAGYNSAGATVLKTGGNSYGGVVFAAGPSGQPLNLNAIGQGTVSGSASLSLPSDYLTGSTRLVAMGFEVVNTTSDLYRQGLVTVYRQPQPPSDPFALTVTGNVASNPSVTGTGVLQCDAPTSVGTAMLLEGSRQWKAADGSYSVVTRNNVGCPCRQLSPDSIIYLDQEIVTGANNATVIGPTIATGLGNLMDRHNLNTSGAYYSGLSLQTTLTLNVIFYVERFPSSFNPPLAVLTHPSASYDPVALEIYSRAMCGMPPGVPQWENGLGEWFRDVIDNIRPALGWLKTGLGAIPHPVAQAGSALVDQIARVGPNPPPRRGRLPPGETYQDGSRPKPKTRRKRGIK
jgi:hypothetical protein